VKIKIDLEKKAANYGIDSATVDGMDVLAVDKAANEAVEKVRTTGKPFFFVCNTYRFRAHSMFDAELYRDKTEVEEWKKRDPILTLQQVLFGENIILQAAIEELNIKVEEEVQKAVDFAEAGTWEPVENIAKFVYSENKT
jgi:pyruvate dehydrogenase E1 component alpha subunit/2-oxoisovalerate dehydrogenase E1 component